MTHKKKKQKGAAGFTVILSMIVFLVLTGFSIDVANIFLKKADLQRALDASVVAGLTAFGREDMDRRAVRRLARNLIRYNLNTMGYRNGEFGRIKTWFRVDGDNIAYLRASGILQGETMFMRYIGIRNIEVRAQSEGLRRPIAVSLVLDSSTSIDETELAAIQQAARTFVNQFADGIDQMSLVTYGADVDPLYRMQPLDRGDIIREINGIQRSWATNIPGAIAEGRRQLERVRNREVLRVMLLFTDGIPNVIRDVWIRPHPDMLRDNPDFRDPEGRYNMMIRHASTIMGSDPPAPAGQPDRQVVLRRDIDPSCRYQTRNDSGILVRFSEEIGTACAGLSEPPTGIDALCNNTNMQNCLLTLQYRDSMNLPRGYNVLPEPAELANWFDGKTAIPRSTLRHWLYWESMNLSIVESDYIKDRGAFIYTVGYGDNERTLNPGAPYQDDAYQNPIGGGTIKTFFLRRVANSPDYLTGPRFPAPYDVSQNSRHPVGEYYETPRVEELETIFRRIARGIDTVRLIE